MTTRRRAHFPDLTRRTLALIMAGGQGSRLGELTRWQAKPALSFGGQYRNIDFPLSNCVNSGVHRIGILTQYMSQTLIQHVQHGWGFLAPEMGAFVEVWPAQQRRGPDWYAGTADAVYQNIDLVEEQAPDHVLVLAGDHVYKMDYGPMLEAHAANAAAVTVGCVEVPVAEAGGYGVMDVDSNGWVGCFDEKPADPKPMPHDPGRALASMGIYVFERRFLVRCLEADAADAGSGHDFGHDILPALIRDGRVLSHAFGDGQGRPGYWRDIGTLDNYWRAHMELLVERPAVDLNDASWPLWTRPPRCAPARFVGDGRARSSIVAAGCRVAGGVERSVLATGAVVGNGASVEKAVVLPGAQIGRNCRIRRAVIDAGCRIPDGTVIDDDLVSAAGACSVTRNGIVLVTAEAVEATEAGEATAAGGQRSLQVA